MSRNTLWVKTRFFVLLACYIMVHKLYNQILDIPIVMCSRFKMGKGGEVGGGGAMLIPPQLIPNRFDKSSVATYCHIIPASHCPIHHQGLE